MFKQNDIRLPSTIEQQDKYFVIAGFAHNGPVNVPFIIKDDVHPLQVLGDCHLTDAYISVREQGVNPLVLRLNGKHGITEVKKDGETVFLIKTVQAHDSVNNIRIRMEKDYMSVVGYDTDRSYFYNEYKSVTALCEAINSDARYGLGEITAQAVQGGLSPVGLVATPYELFPEDGSSESNMVPRLDGLDSSITLDAGLERLKEYLLDEGTNSYSHTGELMSFTVDTILLPDFPYDVKPEVAELIGKYALSKTEEQGAFCSAVLGVMNEDVTKLIEIGNKGKTADYYAHVEVVIGREEGTGEQKEIAIAPRYAATRYLLPIDNSATNKEIPHIRNLFSSFYKEDVARLSASGYTCIVPSIRKGYVAFKSVSFIENQKLISSRPHYNRASRFYADYLVSNFDSMIGDPISRLKLTTIEHDIRERVDKLKHVPIFKEVAYELEISGPDTIRIPILFAFYGEIETVQSTATYDTNRKAVVAWT